MRSLFSDVKSMNISVDIKQSSLCLIQPLFWDVENMNIFLDLMQLIFWDGKNMNIIVDLKQSSLLLSIKDMTHQFIAKMILLTKVNSVFAKLWIFRRG